MKFIIMLCCLIFSFGCITWPIPEPVPEPPTPVPEDFEPYQTNDETGKIVWVRDYYEDLWEAVECLDGFQHGNQNEDVYRDGCFQEAKNADCMCLRVEYRPKSFEVWMHLLHFEHPDRNGYFLSTSWYERAPGIQWQISCYEAFTASSDPVATAKEIAYLFKAYPPGSVEFQVPDNVKDRVCGILRPIVK